MFKKLKPALRWTRHNSPSELMMPCPEYWVTQHQHLQWYHVM